LKIINPACAYTQTGLVGFIPLSAATNFLIKEKVRGLQEYKPVDFFRGLFYFNSKD
jgi:hypothetical protein